MKALLETKANYPPDVVPILEQLRQANEPHPPSLEANHAPIARGRQTLTRLFEHVDCAVVPARGMEKPVRLPFKNLFAWIHFDQINCDQM